MSSFPHNIVTFTGIAAITLATANDPTHRYGSRRPMEDSFARHEESRRRDKSTALTPAESRAPERARAARLPDVEPLR